MGISVVWRAFHADISPNFGTGENQCVVEFKILTNGFFLRGGGSCILKSSLPRVGILRRKRKFSRRRHHDGFCISSQVLQALVQVKEEGLHEVRQEVRGGASRDRRRA